MILEDLLRQQVPRELSIYILRDDKLLAGPHQCQVLGIQEASIPGMPSLEEELEVMSEEQMAEQPEEQMAEQLEEQMAEQPEEQMAMAEEEAQRGIHHHRRIHHHPNKEEPGEGACQDDKGALRN